MKRITICADDYAQSPAISVGILKLLERGRIGAVSCMADSRLWPQAARELKNMAGNYQAGLHFNLTHGSRSLGFIMGSSLSRTLNLERVRLEFLKQWENFVSHYGAPPAFVDGHQHVHAFPGIRQIVVEETARLNPAAWIRTLNAPANFPASSLKESLVTKISKRLARDVQVVGLRTNSSFAGFRPYRGEFDFCKFFGDALHGCPDGTLIMCHPGKAVPDPRDPISHCRGAELDYLLSDQFLDHCEKSMVAQGTGF